MAKPIIRITAEAYHKIRGYVLASDVECSMLAEVETIGEKFVVTEIHLPEQTRSPAFTKITLDGVMSVLSKPGVNPQKIKAWFHSHVNMGVTASATDEEQAKELRADAEWFIRGIFNKKGDSNISIHWMGMDIDADLEVVYGAEYDMKAIKAELESVTVKEVTFPRRHTSPHSGKTEFELRYGDAYDDGGVGYDPFRTPALGYEAARPSMQIPVKGTKQSYINQKAANQYITKGCHDIYAYIEGCLSYTEWKAIINPSPTFKGMTLVETMEALAVQYEDYVRMTSMSSLEESLAFSKMCFEYEKDGEVSTV